MILAVILGAAAVAGEPVKLDSKFDFEEVRFVKQTGTSTVSGKVIAPLRKPMSQRYVLR